jgi:F-type H+-transporting ATPase subunit b
MTMTTPIKKMMARNTILRSLVVFGLMACLWHALTHTRAFAQAQTAPQPSGQPAAAQADQPSGEKDAAQKPDAKPAEPAAQSSEADHHPKGIAGELAKETREAEGEDQEENQNLKHSTMVQKLAKITGLSVHGAHLLALGLNFAIIVIVIFWFARKTLPGLMRARTESIQQALQEARAASQDATKRLADIENRLRQMDVEIGRMQASAEKDAEGEEARIQKAAEQELRKIVQSAEQEIAAAAKQVRRELSVHTADLALALARKQINVDANTDQVLVRNFATKLAGQPGAGDSSPSSSRSDGGKSDGGSGKDGR